MSTSCGTLTVQSPFSNSNVSITSCPNPGTLAPSKTSTLGVTVQNNNSKAATVNIQIMTGSGLDIGSATATVSANSSKTVSVQYAAPSSPGSYTLSAKLASVSASTASATGRVSTAAKTAHTNMMSDLPGALVTAGAGAGALGAAYYLG